MRSVVGTPLGSAAPGRAVSGAAARPCAAQPAEDASNPSVAEFRRMCVERGMLTLRADGFTKVGLGLTTVDEVLRVTESTI